MARITWGAPEERVYETGVDQGVLYIDSVGYAWNGLINVSESPTGGEPRPAYLDGVKFRNLASKEEFEASVEAFSAPLQFGACDGNLQIHNGLFATQQKRKKFDLSYRTKVGNATEGDGHGYKINIVYNALAKPATVTANTLSDSVEVATKNWSMTTLSPVLAGLKPTAHFVIDSRHTPAALLAELENILYGSASTVSRSPSASELVDLFKNWT